MPGTFKVLQSLEQAELKIKQLSKENKKLKTKAGPAVVQKSPITKGFAIPKPEKRKAEPFNGSAQYVGLKGLKIECVTHKLSVSVKLLLNLYLTHFILQSRCCILLHQS